jgi:LysR family glycine cleavage system transcriptional activator
MSRRLPPLNGLRAFEAAARHLSFAKAAEELNVTPAAISHQVKGLEDFLGVKLFRRAKRAIWLTEAGQACLPELREGFDLLASAMSRLRGVDESGLITVSTPPSFTGKWLVPRLERFRLAHPEIDVRVDATHTLVDFAREDVDVAIRYGSGSYPGLASELLLCDEVYPVCSPALLEGPHPLRTPHDLRWHTLLHEDSMTKDETDPDWRMWLLAAGVKDVDASRGPRFSGADLVTQAAAEGQGVALGRGVVSAADLAAGRLVRPFAGSSPVAFAYYIVCPKVAVERPKVAAFCKWLHTEARRHREESGQVELAVSVGV